jgi:carbamoyltransferase
MVLSRLRNRKSWGAVLPMVQGAFPDANIRASIHQIEHHYAHIASAFFVSPYEQAVAVSVDGFDDFASAAWGVGHCTNLTLDGQVHFPHSLGIFYQALTQYLGFRHYGDEYKVMGLAPYGAPRFMDAMRKIVELPPDGTFRLNLRYFVHHSENVPYEWNGGSPSIGTLYSPALADILGPPRDPAEPLEDRHRDLARSVQAMYEEAFFHLLNNLHDRYSIPRLALAGGCAFNSVANGKIRRNTPFADTYIQAAAGDAGGAIGAAYAVSLRLGNARGEPMTHAYWGPSFGERAIATVVTATTPRSPPRAAAPIASRTKRRCAGGPPRRSPPARS